MLHHCQPCGTAKPLPPASVTFEKMRLMRPLTSAARAKQGSASAKAFEPGKVWLIPFASASAIPPWVQHGHLLRSWKLLRDSKFGLNSDLSSAAENLRALWSHSKSRTNGLERG